MKIFNNLKLNASTLSVAILFIMTYMFLNQFIHLATGVFFGFILVYLLFFIDDFFLDKINTLIAIKDEKNQAYSQFLIAIAICLSTGFLCATLLFFALK